MTTDVLAQLRAAWDKAAIAAPPKPPRPAECSQHIDPREWLDEPALNRGGWIWTTCRRCEEFIGYRPATER